MPTPPIRHTQEYISLREYMESRLAAIDKATEAARSTMDKRLDGMNEFGDTLRDQNSTFLPKTEFNIFRERNDEDIRSLRESRAELSGKASQTAFMITLVISLIGLALSIIKMFS